MLEECCRRGNVSAQVKVSSGFGHDKCNTRPADVMVSHWSLGKPAAFDLTVASPLNPFILSEAGVKAGSAALKAVRRKHDWLEMRTTSNRDLWLLGC